MGKLLAIDYGTKRVGLAISDEDKIHAFPINVLETKSEKQSLEFIQSLVEKENVETILIGMPTAAYPEEKNLSVQIKSFAENLKKITQKNVITWNESMTTQAARQNTKELKKRYVDSEAARIMLREYLDFTENA